MQLQSWLVSESIPTTLAEPGQELDLGNSASLKDVAVNPGGSVLLVKWKNFRALLPIGMDFDGLQAVGSDPGLAPLSVLLLANSGYAPLNPPDWIANLSPRLSILSVSAADPYGLPDPETLSAVKSYPLLRTDHSGWVRVSTDGNRMWVETEK